MSIIGSIFQWHTSSFAAIRIRGRHECARNGVRCRRRDGFGDSRGGRQLRNAYVITLVDAQ